MGRAARIRVQRMCSWQRVTDETLAVYVAERPRSRRALTRRLAA
jgi:hypothetical protein